MSGVDTGESDPFDIRLPIQFQGIFDGEKFKLGEYTGLLGYEAKAEQYFKPKSTSMEEL